MKEKTHLDLFTGIGGFSLAAAANGVQTVCQVEVDPHCRAFLKKSWPAVHQHDDIKTFNGAEYSGNIWLLTAGVPCQPASRAGKQGGASDHRWLWPDALRVFKAVRPTWALFENPPGIGDVGLGGICAAVEAENYTVRVFSIPACAVNAPHRRERYWIVFRRLVNATTAIRQCAESEQARRSEPEEATGSLCEPSGSNPSNMADAASRGQRTDGGAQGNSGHADKCYEGGMGDTEEIGGGTGLRDCEPRGQRRDIVANTGQWDSYVWLPCADGKVRRAPDDSISMAHGLPVELLEELGTAGRQTPAGCETHRSILAALGNSIVWQVASEIVWAMIQAEDEPKNSC